MSLIQQIRQTFFNYNKSSALIFRDLIFYTNGFWLPLTGVSYSAPVQVTTGSGATAYLNTAITVEIDYGPGVPNYGSKTFFYGRVSLATMAPVPGAQPIVITSYPITAWELLPLINAYYGLQLTEADVLDTVYASPDGPFILTAAPGSLVFTGTLVLPIAGYTPPPPTSDGTDGTTGGGGSDGTGGSGGGSTPPQQTTWGTDGTDPVFPYFEPNGESGVDDLSRG